MFVRGIPTGMSPWHGVPSPHGRAFSPQADRAGLSRVPAYNSRWCTRAEQTGKDGQEPGMYPTTLKSATAFWHNRGATAGGVPG
jgi:hypothetical protein